MLKSIFALVLIISFPLQAAIHVGQISQIDYPQTSDEEPLLFMSDGSVLKINSKEKSALLPYIEAHQDQTILKIMTNKERQILAVETIEKKPSKSIQSFSEEDYTPTILRSEDEARKIFNSLRRGARSRSQCYNRAHIWGYESKKTHDLNSMKVFLFFTRKYIRQYNFDWWFHVSPFTYVTEKMEPNERVLDFKFSRQPLPMKAWTDIFMYNDVECLDIQKYSEYANNQNDSYCYLFKTSMYTYQPIDLEAQERTGALKRDWVKWEVNNAYRNGFTGWW